MSKHVKVPLIPDDITWSPGHLSRPGASHILCHITKLSIDTIEPEHMVPIKVAEANFKLLQPLFLSLLGCFLSLYN